MMNPKVKTNSLLLAILLIFSLMSPLAPAQAATQTFSDVNPMDWHYNVIMKMTQDGYLSGYGDGTFRPDKNVTAAEMIAILHRAFRNPSELPSGSQWGTFRWNTLGWFPSNYFLGDFNSVVSRNTVCYFLLLAKNKPILNQSLYLPTGLKDPISDSVFTCYKYGYVSGYQDGMFHGANLVTRAELCAIIYRAIYENPNPIAPHVDYEISQPYQLYGFTDTFTAGQSMQAAMMVVPENVRIAFQNAGFVLIGATNSEYQRLWNIYTKSEFAFSSGVFFYNKSDNGEQGGIMVANLEASTVSHEFGHYLYYFHMDSDKVASLYQQEKDGVVKAAARQYGGSNVQEFIAEAFRCYCTEPDLLRHHAPNTYAYIAEVVKNV